MDVKWGSKDRLEPVRMNWYTHPPPTSIMQVLLVPFTVESHVYLGQNSVQLAEEV